MSSGFRITLLLVILGCCAAGYFYTMSPTRSVGASTHQRAKRAPSTEEEKLAVRLVQDKDFLAVDQKLDQFRKDDVRTSDGLSSLSVAYDAIAEELTDLEKYQGLSAVMSLFDEWKKANGTSQARRVTLACFYKDAAWRARGADVASKVRKDQWKTFEALLTKAFDALSEAKNAEPYDPAVPDLMLTIGMAAGMPKSTAQDTIEELIKKYPTYEGAYQAMVVYLLPRWQGEPGDLEKFMADVRNRLPKPQGDIMYAHMTRTVFHYVGTQFLLQTELKYDDMKSAFEALFQMYPEDERSHHALTAIAAIADDKDMTAKLLQETTGTWTTARIQKEFRSTDAFAQVQEWIAGDAENPLFVTPLEAAFEQGDVRKLQAAVQSGADLDRRFTNGSTPLIKALSLHEPGLVRYLLDHGASTTATARNGYTVAAAAVNGDNVDLMQKFLDDGLKPGDEVNRAHYTIAHVAALSNSVECMKLILKLPGVDVNAKLPNGQTPIFMAAMSDSAECAKLLLDAGADPNAKQTNLITPVHQAAYSGSPKTLKLLLEHGGNADARSDCNVSPIDEARRNHQEQTEKILAAALKKR